MNIGIKLYNTLASPMRKLGEKKRFKRKTRPTLFTTYILLRR
jgi:hypothetical protein